MKQAQITPEAIANWQQEATAQLASGWKIALVRRQLVRSGCTPELVDQILRRAQGGVTKGNRRAGRLAILTGIGLMLLGVAIVAVQVLVFRSNRVAVPIGLIAVGALSVLTGLLKAVFG
jgi:hypothetical protein